MIKQKSKIHRQLLSQKA